MASLKTVFFFLFRAGAEDPVEAFYIDVLGQGTYGHFNADGARRVAAELAAHIRTGSP